MRKFVTIALASSTLIALNAASQDIALQNAKLWTGEELIEGATVIIRNGSVISAGTDALVPSGIETIDADGSWVTPGIFSAFSRIGIVEVGAEDPTNDTVAPLSGYSAALDMTDAYNPLATNVAVTRISGVTRAAIAPSFGSGLFGGQGFIADMSGKPESVTRQKAFTFINMGEAGAGLEGGSRPAAWATLRAALVDARTYPARFIANNEGDALNRVDAQALAPAAKGQQLILIAVSRASDIRNVIELKNANPSLRIALVGAEEGWMVANELASANVGVIIDPYANLPGAFERLGSTQENAARLIEAGVTTAFAYFDDDSHQSRLVLQSAGNAVGSGVDHEDALRAITSAPAAIFGLPRLGSLMPGSAGDLVIWDGDPLEVTSAPVRIFIEGNEQSLTSRQTKLRDRYLNLDENERPLAYRPR